MEPTFCSTAVAARSSVYDPSCARLPARAEPNSGGSQIFINTVHTDFLDYWSPSPSKHPVFGKVVEGEDIVMSIETVQTGPGDKPVEPVVVTTIEIAES